MKFTTIYLGENKIELSNSLLGKETVQVNGEIVSQKYSMMGAEHHFIMKENGTISECNVDFGLGIFGAVFSLYVNDQPVVESNEIGRLVIIVLVVIGLVAGFIWGIS